MTGIFDYQVEIKRNAQLIVDDVGNTTLRALNDFGEEYFLIIRTNNVGTTRIFSYGPYNEDVEVPRSCVATFEKIDYEEYKVKNKIKSWLNDYKRAITSAMEVDIEEIRDKLKNLADLIV